ncbi:uncharacterized protein SAPINGB_P003558 [Magnusiomyces paraingens]|uniref:UDP-N-acetylglucosamine transferase subunit ALG14 n=1 Tax=Magnusiomyces paraingens TaxID=2606893 RepID=A0A5E8BVC8_9ASCO|nr:uncharacterized protein SAPINGB_P003558 [Saprochaete ingens]VVT53407.1 unnamed protein product [Saprochaete ingens]
MWSFQKIFFISLFAAAVRIWFMYRDSPRPHHHKRAMILLGSGGHTGEMLRIFHHIRNFPHITWVITIGDSLSLEKLAEHHHTDDVIEIPRARYVGQPYSSAINSSLVCLAACLSVIYNDNPDVLITNGPGSSVMLCYAALLLRFFGLVRTRIIYIESFARVNELSLTGRLLYPAADDFLVQWPQLHERYPNTRYTGHLI